jgi:hypothetical protein
MKILLDENLPHKLRLEIHGHEVFTTAFMGWAGIENGSLLTIAGDNGFGVLITNDRGLEYEQNQDSLPISVIVLLVKSNTIESLRPLLPSVQATIAIIKRGELVKLTA